MPDLLLELLTEEIPARMQGAAARELKRLVEIELEEMNLEAKSVETFVTPRRLTLAVAGLPKAQAATEEERRGPRVGAPEQAVQGFLKSAGLTSLDQCEKRSTDKGEFYFVIIRRPGRATKDVLPAILEPVIRNLPWPKSMRFPAADFRWVRPLTGVLSLFDGKVLKLDLGSVPVGNKSEGHRFLSKGEFAVRDFKDYRAKLKAAKVILDAGERRAAIVDSLNKLARKSGYTVKDDPELLDEVTGLVEWPVVLMGSIDDDFMVLPAEVLATSMRKHQKYFTCVDKKGEIQAHFLMISNMQTSDGGKAIIAGNEHVLRARLADARFFWDQDRKVKLADRVPKLKERIFHAKLGSMYDKTQRLIHLAESMADRVGAHHERDKVGRAAELAKADLSSGMVGEFPELQGVMGGYYALNDGEAPEIADAVAEHYAPQGPSDRCPVARVSIAVALADKIDNLMALFSIDEIPTGSKDPFGLRRAALGIVRLILENKLDVDLRGALRDWLIVSSSSVDRAPQVLGFIADRLKVHLRERGVRHDYIDAVFLRSLPKRGPVIYDSAGHLEVDLKRLIARVDALTSFLNTDDGVNLLTAYRRASNIVKIEEKKDGRTYAGEPDKERFRQNEEKMLAMRLASTREISVRLLLEENFAGAMATLAGLREPVDRFFDKVTVNTEDKELRENRLRLMSQIRDTLNLVADFSKIEG